MDAKLDSAITTVESQFQRLFVTQLATLLTEDGAYLSFVGGMAAVDALACLHGGAARNPQGHFQNEAMFTNFVTDLFPVEYHQRFNLWTLRNSIIHRFVVHEGFILKFDDPDTHTKRRGNNVVHLDARSFLADLTGAAKKYFDRLRKEPDLQTKFEAVCREFGVIGPSVYLKAGDTAGTARTDYGTTIGGP
jgi:hypothetical protein